MFLYYDFECPALQRNDYYRAFMRWEASVYRSGGGALMHPLSGPDKPVINTLLHRAT